MKKRIIYLLLIIIAITIIPVSCRDADNITANDAAEKLHDLGLLAGVGTNADGSINFDTSGSLTRAQSITQVVRFLGKEKEATENANEHPFTDLPAWSVPYVSYAYANGVTKGVSNTKFAPDNAMTEAAFLTAILRVLGYNDAAGDFTWSAPHALAKETGLITDTTANESFTRGDAFVICYRALFAAVKGENKTIADTLIADGVITKEKYNEVTKQEELKTEFLSITDLKQKSEEGDHANDDYRTSSLEINYRENVVLTSVVTEQTRYDQAYYPRVKMVNDNLYLLLFMYSELGQHLYYATSADGINWNPPEVLWNSIDYKFTYEYGELEGTADRYHAVNADACVLDDGSVLCVYAVRAVKGYRTYPELCGLYMKRGTVNEKNELVWSDESRIYTGQVWEPSVLKRSDGQIQVYFTQVAPDIMKYGYDEVHRSTGTAIIVSNDNGETWTPDIKADDKNYYHAHTVYQEYVGDKDGRPHFNGQMPVATELINGKILLAVEVKDLNGKFRISYAMSDEGGNWKNLGEEEEGVYTKLTAYPNSSPYVSRFTSGEVYLTHNYGGELVGRIGSPDGTGFGNTFNNAPGVSGIWGSCSVIGSHKAVTAMQNKNGELCGINLYYSYLNHRVNAPKKNIAVDGYTNDWNGNNDSLFVGSESQAQINLRTAHDNDNLYFLITRHDYYLTDGDNVTVCIAKNKTADYRITIDLFGNTTLDYYSGGVKKSTSKLDNTIVKIMGTMNDNSDKDVGAIFEIAVPKSLVDLAGKTEFNVRPAIENMDGSGSISDTITGASVFSTALWPKIVLD